MKSRLIYLPICLAVICAGSTVYRPVAAMARAAAEGDQAFDGIWRSRGYGWLWRISGGRIEGFDIGEDYCVPNSSFAEDTPRP